ncbi:EamA domain-containing protein [[Candida] zeylanoides]
MAISVLQPDGSAAAASKSKVVFIAFLFVVSLVSFVCQTEFTSSAYKLGFKEPIFLLFITHGSWWALWPLQVLVVATWRTWDKFHRDKAGGSPFSAATVGPHAAYNNPGPGAAAGAARYQRLDSHSQLLEEQPEPSLPPQALASAPRNAGQRYLNYFRKSIVKQMHNVYHTSILVYECNVNGDERTENLHLLIDQNPHISATNSIWACGRSLWPTPSFQYILRRSLAVTVVLTVAGSTWYAAMSLTYASDVTAIYNCSAFTAYAFAIPLLGERFSWLKASSVVVAVGGVFVVAYSGESSSGGDAEYPYRFFGNLLILVGAVLYGYYEVLYKKYLCVAPHLATVITPRRQMAFANFVMAFLGVFTWLILATGMAACQLSGLHDFALGGHGARVWGFVSGSVVSNLVFSGSFLSLMALTSPVLSSVSSLLTIFLIGIVEWVLYGTTLSSQQLAGDMLVVIGFVLLTTASWKEISEGRDDDDVDAVSTYSMAISTETT